MGLFRSRARVLLPALLFSILAASAPAQFVTGPETPKTEPLTKERKDEILSDLEGVITKRAFVPGVDLAKWPEFLAKQRDAIDKAETDAEFARAVNAAMRDFGVSHIRFLAPRAAQSRVRTSTIGIGINARAEKDGLTITSVFPKSPADNAGIKQGEMILLVDGKVPEGIDTLQGDEGSEVGLKVRDKDGKEREVKIKRERYSTLREDYVKWFGDDAAVLKIHSFNRGYTRANIENLLLEASKAKYLVLDLRSNGGGATNNLQHLLSLLMPEDTIIGTFVSRAEATRYAENHTGDSASDPIAIAKEAKEQYKTRRLPLDPFKGKIAVLVNRGSASASEICAEALRENLGSPVVGTKSMGAVLASIFRKLPYGYEVQFPISDYVSKNGVRLEKNPIVPDVEITERAEGDKDPVVDAAIAKLKGK